MDFSSPNPEIFFYLLKEWGKNGKKMENSGKSIPFYSIF